jgi:hypothetical protein
MYDVIMGCDVIAMECVHGYGSPAHGSAPGLMAHGPGSRLQLTAHGSGSRLFGSQPTTLNSL